MKPGTNPNFEELFAGAVGLAEPERSRFLDIRCGEDTELRLELEELLRCHDEAGDFMEVPPITAAPSSVVMLGRDTMEERTPSRIGHFRIERVLGTGGMGRVYLAESEQPRRLVALKMVRASHDGSSLRRRFEQEAQVIALLQHPGIAQLYEAGAADCGDGVQPFFAMEYVDGLPLTEHAKRHELTTRQRLELFCRVCDAVDHAHDRGVVHRDLKPGNILVDSSGQPKILDFGVARLMDPETRGGAGAEVCATTLHTQAGQLIGTLSYMSPEQVSGKPGKADARSDVYSLGVMLFELLAGRLPHDVSSRSIPEAIRAIKEDAPTSLSTLDKGLRGDVETIVGKAMEKEPERRYQSAAALAADIRRCLRDEPIVARPPSTWYQLSKFAKRNKTLVGGVAATMLALSGGLVAAVWQAREAGRAREEAQLQASAAELARDAEEKAKIEAETKAKEAEESREAAEKAKKSAEESLQVSQEVNRFMEQLFMSPDPDERMGRDVTVMRVLDRTSEQMEERFESLPHVKGVMHRTIGGTYRSLTEYAKAEIHVRAAYEIHRELYGEEHEETVQSMTSLILVLSDRGRHKEAIELGQRQWEIVQRMYPEDHPERLTIASNLGQEMMAVGDWQGAEALQRYVLEHRQKLFAPDDSRVIGAMNNLGRTLSRTGRLREAIELQREAVARFRKSGRLMDSVSFGVVLGLANSLLEMREHDEAEQLANELIEEGAELFHPEHNAILTARNARAQVMLRKNRAVEAEKEFRELVDLQSKSEVPATDGLVRVRSNLGEALRLQGRLDEAEAEYRKALRMLDDSAPDRLRIGLLNNLVTTLRLKKDFEGALPICKELVEVSEKVLAPDDWAIAVSKYSYGVVLMAMKKGPESEAQLEGAYEIAMKTFTEQDEPVIAVMRSLVNLYELWQKPDKAAFWRAKLPEKYR